MATDLATTTGTNSGPVVTSASYNFVARDEGHWLYIGAGTGWIPGWYQILTTSGNAATLTAAVGTGYLSVGGIPYGVTTAQGCCTAATPGGNGTWSIDYSQNTAIAFTDLIIDGTTNTDATSSTKPLGKNFVGNIFNVTSGTGFTVQRAQLLSIPSGVIGRFDKSLGTLSSTGGNATAGGPLATPGLAGGLLVASNSLFVQAATYTCSNSSNVASGRVTISVTGTLTSPNYAIGWNTHRHTLNTDSTRPTLNASANSVLVITVSGNFTIVRNFNFGKSAAETSVTGLNMNSTHAFCDSCSSTSVATGFSTGASSINTTFENCFADTCSQGYVTASNGGSKFIACISKAHTTNGFNIGDYDGVYMHCIAYNGSSTSDGFALSGQGGVFMNCTAYGNGGDGFSVTTGGGLHLLFNCVATGNAAFQYNQTTSTETSRRLYNCAAKADGSGTDNLNASQKMGFIILGSDPFVSGSTGNFALNSTSDGGTLLKAAAFPGVFSGISSTGYLDIGAVQSGLGAPSAGSGGGHVLTSSIIKGLGAV